MKALYYLFLALGVISVTACGNGTTEEPAEEPATMETTEEQPMEEAPADEAPAAPQEEQPSAEPAEQPKEGAGLPTDAVKRTDGNMPEESAPVESKPVSEPKISEQVKAKPAGTLEAKPAQPTQPAQPAAGGAVRKE